MSLRSFGSFASNAISSAYARVQIFYFPTLTPAAWIFLMVSSKSAIYIVNNIGLSGHPCLTPAVVHNLDDISLFAFIVFLVSLYISPFLILKRLLISFRFMMF